MLPVRDTVVSVDGSMDLSRFVKFVKGGYATVRDSAQNYLFDEFDEPRMDDRPFD